MGKTRRVILHPVQCMTLYNEIGSTTAFGQDEKDLAAADRELGKIVNARRADTFDGKVLTDKPKDTVEAEFSFPAMRGFKTVFIQCISGFGQTKPPAHYGFKTHNLILIIKAFGKKMVAEVEEKTKSEMSADNEIDWNEETTESTEESVDSDN